MTKIVIDTNVWLHCRFFRELPWVEFVGDDTEILIPPVLLRELDKHKNGPRAQLRDRARRVLREFERILQETQTGASVADRLTMTVITQEPELGNGLDKDVADDRFFATVLASAEPRPLLVSNDIGVRIRARGMGLAVLAPPDEWLLPDEPDEAQQLKRDLELMKTASPRVALHFTNGKSHKAATVRAIGPASDKLVAERMAELRRQHPLHAEAVPYKDFYAARMNIALNAFYEEYEKYLRDRGNSESRRELFVPIALSLSNDGSAPAEDLDVVLQVNVDHATLSNRKPSRQAVPRPPDSDSVLGGPRVSDLALSELIRPSIASNTNPNVTGAELGAGTNDVRYRIRRVKHGVPVDLHTFYVKFDRADRAKGFSIQYTIHAANVRKPIEGLLNVSVETRTLSFDEFLAEKEAAARKRRADLAEQKP